MEVLGYIIITLCINGMIVQLCEWIDRWKH